MTLAPLARAALQLLSELYSCSASSLVTRLLHEEMARRAPGAWTMAATRPMAGTPEERMTEVLRVLREWTATRG